MTSDAHANDRIIGSLRSADGTGIVRIEDRIDTDIDDLWSALTDPKRLTGWYGEVDGELRPGGALHLHVVSDGWYGTGHVDACEPPGRLRVTTRETDESWKAGQGAAPFDETIELTLTGDGDRTHLVIEVGGLPLDKIAFYGVGWQIHVEHLAAYLAGRDAGDTEARWDQLIPPYKDLAAKLG
ncbi:MAG TPA: SRPBCC domain-containing protein [Actinomycetota bacterium]|jgi:uncharacterized protein YndB with AHSA1/START domain